MSGFKYITMAADTEQANIKLSTSHCLKHMLCDPIFGKDILGLHSSFRMSEAFKDKVAGDVVEVTTEDWQRLSKVCKGPTQGAAGYPSLTLENTEGKTIGNVPILAATLLPHLEAAIDASDSKAPKAESPKVETVSRSNVKPKTVK